MRGGHVSKGVRRRVKEQRRAKKRGERERKKRDKVVTSKYGMDAHSACGRKKRYETEMDAMARVNMSKLIAGVSLRAYKCPYCDGWHLTSKPKRDK